MGAVLMRILLEACAAAGKAREGLDAAEMALQLGSAAGFCEAEAHRLRTVFLAALGASAEEVEAGYRRALEVARRQGAISLERRAAASLLRWREERGDNPGANEARALLAEILARLPEEV